LKYRKHIAGKVFEKAITDLDDYLRNKRERGKLKNTGKREKYFLTRFGDIRLLLGSFRSPEAIRQSVIKEGNLIIENQKKKLRQIENLDYPDKEAPDTAYLEADATYITLQKKGQEKGGKLEVKLGVGYTGKEARYKRGKSNLYSRPLPPL
jgi:hypothetical protein